MNIEDLLENGRRFLKAFDWRDWRKLDRDEEKKLPVPPVQKTYPERAKLVDLVPAEEFTVGRAPLIDLIRQRRSRRKFEDQPLSLEDLSFLVWATQGMRESNPEGRWRTVPSGGARHPFETYLVVRKIDGLAPGLYRYLPLEHKLYLICEDADLAQKTADACCRQSFLKNSAVIFIWTAIPYRTEWRYSVVSHKVIAIDAGHVCQNLYLAAESIGAGTCAVGAYYQEDVDAIVGADGKDEFVVYVAPVGKV